jgi:hypothetical protein
MRLSVVEGDGGLVLGGAGRRRLIERAACGGPVFLGGSAATRIETRETDETDVSDCSHTRTRAHA